MTIAEKLRNACRDYWLHRNGPSMVALEHSRERLRRVAEAYRNGWTVDQVTELDNEAKAEAEKTGR